MTAIPCGQKNQQQRNDHSQIVTPLLAAIDGTTFRLNTATTNNRYQVPAAQHAFEVRLVGRLVHQVTICFRV